MRQVAMNVIDKIKTIYTEESDVCMYDLLASITIKEMEEDGAELTFEEVMEIYATLMNWSDNDEFYRINKEDNFKHDIVSGEHTSYKAVIQTTLNKCAQ